MFKQRLLIKMVNLLNKYQFSAHSCLLTGTQKPLTAVAKKILTGINISLTYFAIYIF